MTNTTTARLHVLFLAGGFLFALTALLMAQLHASAAGNDAAQQTAAITTTPSATPTMTATVTTTPTATVTITPTTTVTPTVTPEPGQDTLLYLPVLANPGAEPLPPPIPVFAPPPIDFDAVRAAAEAQGLELSFNKIGFHVGVGDSDGGPVEWKKPIKQWIETMDAAGVPVFLKSANNAEPLYIAQELMKQSGVDHILVYRDAGRDLKEHEYSLPPETAAQLLWERNRDAFPPELDPSVVWIETINEPDKNRAEWLAQFSLETARRAVAEGYKYAAFSWAPGEPEPFHWDSPAMLEFLRFAAQHPDQVAVALHEYSLVGDYIGGPAEYPWLVGRFQKLFAVCDRYNIPRPTVLITEWGWEYDGIPSVAEAMEDIAWASWLYAAYPQVKGAAIWYLGPGFSDIDKQVTELIPPLTDFSLSNYYLVTPGWGPIDEGIFRPNPPTAVSE